MFLKFKKLLNNANKYFMKLQPKRVLSFGMALTVTFVAFNFNSAAYADEIPTRRWWQRLIRIFSKVVGTLADNLGPTLVPGIPGQIVSAGGKVLVAIDPPAGRFFDGRTTIKFNPSLVSLDRYGYFGDWGINPLLPPPDVNVPPEGTPWNLQLQPNPSLTSTITFPNSNTIRFDWDWGPNGYIPPTLEHFNFLGLEFTALQDTTLGELDDAITLPDNIIFYGPDTVARQGNLEQINRCTPLSGEPDGQGGVIVELLCGEPIPEPTSTLSLLSLGILGAGATIKRKVKRTHSIEKEPTNLG
jgi:hypothetical protein